MKQRSLGVNVIFKQNEIFIFLTRLSLFPSSDILPETTMKRQRECESVRERNVLTGVGGGENPTSVSKAPEGKGVGTCSSSASFSFFQYFALFCNRALFVLFCFFKT